MCMCMWVFASVFVFVRVNVRVCMRVRERSCEYEHVCVCERVRECMRERAYACGFSVEGLAGQSGPGVSGVGIALQLVGRALFEHEGTVIQVERFFLLTVGGTTANMRSILGPSTGHSSFLGLMYGGRKT